MGSCPRASGFGMALVPEHSLPGLLRAHHMAPRGAPGHGVDGSAEEREGQASGRHQKPGLQPGFCPWLLEPGSLRLRLSLLPPL